MKKTLIWILAGILIGLAGAYIYLSIRDSPLKRQNEALKKEIAVARVELEVLEKQSLARIEELLEQVGGLQENIDALLAFNENLETTMISQYHALAALEAETTQLKEEIQPVIDNNPRLRAFVDSVMTQLAAEKDLRFTLAKRYETIEEAFFSSEKKSLVLAEEAALYKGLWTREKEHREKVELRLNLQDKRVVSLERRLTLTSVGGVTIAVVALLAILFH